MLLASSLCGFLYYRGSCIVSTDDFLDCVALCRAALDVSAGQETVSMVLNLQQPACDDATCSRCHAKHAGFACMTIQQLHT